MHLSLRRTDPGQELGIVSLAVSNSASASQTRRTLLLFLLTGTERKLEVLNARSLMQPLARLLQGSFQSVKDAALAAAMVTRRPKSGAQN